MSASSLTTGKAARLCSVKPDTVLKWIKKGRLPATRTLGGHYRVKEEDVFQILSDNITSDDAPRDEGAALCSRPMRCWEYMNRSPGTECKECLVFKVHASWCFRMVQTAGTEHSRRFWCGSGLCQDCPYYRRVHGLPSNVLVITRDEGFIRDLSARDSASIAFRFARRGYDASAIISVFRPAFVIFDQAILEELGVALLEALSSDPRAKGARTVVAIRKGTMGFRVPGASVYATVEEPFQADDVVAIIERTPIETLAPETVEA
jgi:excisionase family DNA binding protein